MRSLTTVPFLVRSVIVALVFLVTAGLLFGPASLRPDPRSAEAAFLSEVTKLLSSDAPTADHFGSSVAISGDTAVVGECGSGNCGIPSGNGAAYVFQRDQGGAHNWGEVKKLTASDAQEGDNFGWSVAISGDTAIVGAYREDAGGDQAGAAYVFQRDQGGQDNWGEVTKLTASDAAADDLFGEYVAVSDDTAVVGARGVDFLTTIGANVGAAYVFERDEGGQDNWGEVTKLTGSEALVGDSFGAVAISGDIIIAGALGQAISGGDASGTAYVYQRNLGGADNWGEVKKLTASDAQAFDNFGETVAVSGDTAVVGARGEDGGAGDPFSLAGAAYAFQREEGGTDNWGEVKKLTASDAAAGGGFGNEVAVSGDTAVVGANGDDTEGSFTGASYVFQRDEGGAGNWGEVKKLIASDAAAGDAFGEDVTVSGDTAVVGAPGQAKAGQLGTAYIFQTKLPEPGDKDGDGCTDEQENGPDETLGGLRQWFNPWDYYDVLGPGAALPIDGVIDLANDILGVILHFAPTGAAPYDVQFDRGPSAGPNAWNMTAPDGVIDLPNDILGVILQFNHRCA